MRLLTLLLFACVPAVAAGETLAEREVISLAPIRDMKLTVDSQLVYSFLQPCHSESVGLFVQPIKKGHQLRMAVVVRQKGIRCAGMPTLEMRQTRIFHLAGVKKLIKMNPSRITGKLRMGRVAVLRQVGPRGRIEGIWQRRCAKWRGFVLQPEDSQRLGFGFLESVEKDDLQSCRAGQQVYRPRFINPLAVNSLYPIEEHLPIERAFHLRLAPIQQNSLSTVESGGGLKLRYLKRCNESPVGVVIGKPWHSGGMPVGMVVAHFYNRSCDADEPKRAYFEYTSRTYPLKPGIQMIAMRPSRGFGDYDVKPPLQFGFLNDDLQIRFLGSCERDVGVIYSNDSLGRMSVGVLEKVTANSKCKKPTKQLSFKQPYFLSSPNSQGHFPMKVEGATIF